MGIGEKIVLNSLKNLKKSRGKKIIQKFRNASKGLKKDETYSIIKKNCKK